MAQYSNKEKIVARRILRDMLRETMATEQRAFIQSWAARLGISLEMRPRAVEEMEVRRAKRSGRMKRRLLRMAPDDGPRDTNSA